MDSDTQIMAHAFLSHRVVTPEGTRPGALLVEEGRIRAVCALADVPASATITDFGHAAILPGLVDSHVHINEPGRTEWEGFATATRAAAAGGYTMLVDMPLNCLPETTTVAALEAKRNAAEGQCIVDWAPWGGAVADNQQHLLPLAHAGVLGYKCFLIYPGCDGFTMIDQQQLEAALPFIAQSGLPLLVHAELAGPIDRAAANLQQADWRQYATYLASRPDEAEVQAIQLMIRLCRQYHFRLHIVHLSSALALDDLRAARAEGLPITVETCPHYLHFAAESIADGATLLKCAPPIRSQANREALWAALRDGTIDTVVTDHSPCPPAMKRLETGRFDLAWGGIASLSVALPVVWTEASRRGFSLDDIARWMSSAPAALAGIDHQAGTLQTRREATFTVFDPEAAFVPTEDKLHYRHPVSPYLDETLRGVVLATYLRGQPVFRDGIVLGEARGRAISASTILARWNTRDASSAAREILPCCGSQAWAESLASMRPFATVKSLRTASDAAWQALPESAWQEAFDSHPRIGQQHAQKQATTESLQWSAQEQQTALSPDETAKLALAEGNRRCEERFGRIFIVCAAGKSATEILGILNSRMNNDAATELREAAEQQRQITQLRLGRWLGDQ
jgi:allantoinase